MERDALIAPAARQPIVVADAGPPIRLAAAGIRETLRGLNRRIVRGDRVQEKVVGDLSKPFAPEIAAWIEGLGEGLGEAAIRGETVVGIGVAALRAQPRTSVGDALLKSALWASGGLTLREFVAHWDPTESESAVVLDEDREVAALFFDVDFP